MKIPIYHIDAFTRALFSGNPAAVCPLENWPDDSLLKSIAAENYLPATVFFVAKDAYYELRWFTPTTELDLCGHGTLAAAFVIFNYLDPASTSVLFKTRGGELVVGQDDNLLAMDFPAQPATPCSPPPDLVDALQTTPEEVWFAQNGNYLALYHSEAQIRSLRPDLARLAGLNGLGVIVTARGVQTDFVCRYFAPKIGIPEDAVTGSAHCTLAPYWSKKLGKDKLSARKISSRGGELVCEDLSERARLLTGATCYAEGFLYI